MNLPPARAQRPADDQAVGPGTLLMLLLDSIPCVRSGCKPPKEAPLTPEETQRLAEYLSSRPGPAGEAERRKS